MHDEIVIAPEQPMIEIDHAADEFRRENADAAIIEEGDAGSLAPAGARSILEHRVVAEMRVAVNDPDPAERKPPGGEHGGGQAVAHRKRVVLVVKQPPALEPVEREKPAGR